MMEVYSSTLGIVVNTTLADEILKSRYFRYAYRINRNTIHGDPFQGKTSTGQTFLVFRSFDKDDEKKKLFLVVNPFLLSRNRRTTSKNIPFECKKNINQHE